MSLIRSIARGAVGSGVRRRTAGRGILGAGLGLIAARIATRSLPGAALVGGGLVAKYLWDKKREREAAETGGLDARDAEMAAARAEGETDIAAAAAPASEPPAAS
ncbi:hypothetical protein HFP57_12690 [Parasphingopyxis algicola]|uniref:hypothetical protein n=1 Tax=Parasphingopyxis algicola TaxID=2026624 RepID=UPI0015A3B142|nr:hypothetical protein [Parasphingopyxis algicola]QLC25790.1 hypothetical protein HFP57_12690 [Parasphingopyxis algicola]